MSTPENPQQACIEHARHLVASARAVQGIGYHHIAYHLAGLALEELGRRHLLRMQGLNVPGVEAPAWCRKHAENHVMKLFWCFFGGRFLGSKLTNRYLDSLKDAARHIHSTRMAGLYVENGDDGLSIPSEAIAPEETENLIGLAQLSLEVAEAEPVVDELPEDVRALQLWFLRTAEDPVNRKRLLSSASRDKLAELQDAKAWVQWLKEEFERVEAEGIALAEEELARSRAGAEAGPRKNKWAVRFRLETQSHSIRPKALGTWNKRFEWIQLRPDSKRRDQLLVEMTLQDRVTVDALWGTSLGLARHFVTALNIATVGFW